MAHMAVCFITDSNEDRGAFGVAEDTDERVYFPKSVTEACDLLQFDKVEAIVVKNERADPPWKAIRVRNLTAAKKGSAE